MNAIIYCRFSPRPDKKDSAGQVVKCESCEQQAEDCAKWCSANGHVVKAVFKDEKLSGADEDRDGLWDAIEALKRGYVLVVWKFDRLARDAMLAFEIERDVLARGASMVSASGEGSIDKSMSPDAELLIGIRRVFAQYERRIISARTKHAALRHQRNGKRMSAITPYGWVRDPDDGTRLIENADEQFLIADIRRWHASGFGFRSIAAKLNELHVPCRPNRAGTPTKGWRHNTVKAILIRAGDIQAEA